MVCLQNKTVKEVSRALYVSHSTVERLVHLYSTTGEVTPVQSAHELLVLHLFLSSPGIFLKEVQEQLFRVTGKVICSTIIM